MLGSVLAAAAVSAVSGAWSVDLTPPTPGAKPYLQPMQLELRADGVVAGTFYNSPIQAGRWTERGGRTCVSFQTSDGAGPYHTAACTEGAALQGQTWAEHRRFVQIWTAARPVASPAKPQ